MDLLTIFYLVAGLASIVGVQAGIVAIMLWFVSRRSERKRGRALEAMAKTVETTQKDVGRIAEYLDGLPDLKDKRRRELFEKGREHQKRHEHQEAIKAYEALLGLEPALSERAALHILIGNCFYAQSQLDAALGHYKEAEAAAREGQDKWGLASALGNSGIIYQQRGEPDKALGYHEQALAIHREIGDREGEANALGNMGIIYADKAEADKALEYYQQALPIYREIGNREGEGSVLGNIGSIY